MSKSRQTSIYFSPRTQGQIAALKSWGWAGNQTRLVEAAIDRMWRDERKRVVERLRGVIKSVEWIEDSEQGYLYCPVCRNFPSEGHRDDCALDAEIKEKGT